MNSTTTNAQLRAQIDHLTNIIANLESQLIKEQQVYNDAIHHYINANSKTPHNTIEVVRHIRVRDKYGKLSARGGMTLICQMDYATCMHNISFSICSKNDNFSKPTGILIARDSGNIKFAFSDDFKRSHISLATEFFNAVQTLKNPVTAASIDYHNICHTTKKSINEIFYNMFEPKKNNMKMQDMSIEEFNNARNKVSLHIKQLYEVLPTVDNITVLKEVEKKLATVLADSNHT